MGRITLYYKRNDPDIEKIIRQVENLADDHHLTLVDLCLDDDPTLLSLYNDVTPALQIGPYRLKYPVDEKDIQIAIVSYQDRQERYIADSSHKKQKEDEFLHIAWHEKISYWMANNYPLFIAIFLMVYIAVPFLAPILMKTKHDTAANVIYKTYSAVCHQLAFRSYFLFGEQAIYPRELADIPGMITYEQVTKMNANDSQFARNFTGNEVVGYKVAICERDIAIYGSIALFAIFFQFEKKKTRQIPWYIWVIFGVLPIAIDGGSQLFSLGGTWPAWFPIRESTPLLRSLTGVLFGLVTAWYAFPMMEENIAESKNSMARKLAIKKRLIQKAAKS
jgi:uncharacterized membrane protein/mRNA-degrading endonuclease RelE of RelBE toxin-antitoxin system